MMACLPDNDFRYFVKKVLTQYDVAFELPTDVVLPLMQCPHSDIVIDELIETFTKALWFKVKVSDRIWHPFVSEYSLDILESSHSYVSSVLYICKVVNDKTVHGHDRFISVIAAVVSAAVIYYHDNGVQFLRYTAPILITYFESQMKSPFYQRGGWKSLLRYITDQSYLKWYPLRNTHTVVNITGKYAKDIQRHIGATLYRDDIESITPDKVKADSLCEQLAKEVMDNFPEQVEYLEGTGTSEGESAMENLELSQSTSLEVPMETANSKAVPSTSRIDVVETPKESGQPTQASVPAGAQSTPLQAVDISTSLQTSSKTSGHLQENVKSQGEVHLSPKVGTLSSKAPDSQSSTSDIHSSCPPEQSDPVIPGVQTSSGTSLIDRYGLTPTQSSAFLEVNSLLGRIGFDTNRLSEVFETLNPK